MNKPNSHTDWTTGNPNFGLVNVEPTSGKKITGWTPGEAPPIQFMNWLFYNLDQWTKYLEAKTDELSVNLDLVKNSQFSTNLVQELPVGLCNGLNANFTVSNIPSSPTNTFVFKNSLLVPRSEYTLTGRNIIFNGGSVPEAGSEVEALYVIQTGFSGQQNATAPGAMPRVENRVVTTSELAAKQLVLHYAPYEPTATSLDLITEGPQFYGADFIIVGNVVSWSGLALDGVISANDKLRILYFI